MELLEKITLYDLLGYTVPGGVVLLTMWGCEGETELSAFSIIVFFVLSYLLGLIFAEITSWIIMIVWWIRDLRNKVYLKTDLSIDVITKALKNAGIMGDTESITDIKDVWKYYTNMYSDIQVDKTYSRIHNYASAALLYQNMALSVVLCLLICLFKGTYTCEIGLLTVFAFVCFVIRWYRFDERVVRYTLNWYVIKYVKSKTDTQESNAES